MAPCETPTYCVDEGCFGAIPLQSTSPASSNDDALFLIPPNAPQPMVTILPNPH
ncbi:hypothetical protein BJ165DRAFT_1485852 [Panaeolus papilionaceus]|nr:hypothetical protein BJ165DRAFT_1485852 [Panaeolus papilionaceus]